MSAMLGEIKNVRTHLPSKDHLSLPLFFVGRNDTGLVDMEASSVPAQY